MNPTNCVLLVMEGRESSNDSKLKLMLIEDVSGTKAHFSPSLSEQEASKSQQKANAKRIFMMRRSEFIQNVLAITCGKELSWVSLGHQDTKPGAMVDFRFQIL